MLSEKNMPKLKILHVTFDMRIGGTETVIKNLVEGIDSEQFDVEILCIEPNLGPFGEQLQQQGVKITNLNWVGGFDTKLIKAIRQYIKQNNIDILHCHQYTPWVYGTLAAAFSNVKVLFTEHGRFYPDSSSWKRKFVNPVLMAFTSYVTSISAATKQALVEYEFLPEKRIDVIYNGIQPLVQQSEEVEKLKQQYSLPDDAIIMGTVARLDPIKNQTMMLTAFSKVLTTHGNAYLMIVGDGEERDKLENLVDVLDIRANVIFTGYVAKPVNHIALMDAFLLSSLSEGTSMTLLEAMSLKKPCVVTNAGGNPEIIIDDYNGKVTENDDVEAFASGITKLFAEKETIHLYGENSLVRFNEYFHQQVMNQRFAQLYRGEKLTA